MLLWKHPKWNVSKYQFMVLENYYYRRRAEHKHTKQDIHIANVFHNISHTEVYKNLKETIFPILLSLSVQSLITSKYKKE